LHPDLNGTDPNAVPEARTDRRFTGGVTPHVFAPGGV